MLSTIITCLESDKLAAEERNQNIRLKGVFNSGGVTRAISLRVGLVYAIELDSFQYTGFTQDDVFLVGYFRRGDGKGFAFEKPVEGSGPLAVIHYVAQNFKHQLGQIVQLDKEYNEDLISEPDELMDFVSIPILRARKEITRITGVTQWTPEINGQRTSRTIMPTNIEDLMLQS